MDSDFMSCLILCFVMKTSKLSKIVCVLGENFVTGSIYKEISDRIPQKKQILDVIGFL